MKSLSARKWVAIGSLTSVIAIGAGTSWLARSTAGHRLDAHAKIREELVGAKLTYGHIDEARAQTALDLLVESNDEDSGLLFFVRAIRDLQQRDLVMAMSSIRSARLKGFVPQDELTVLEAWHAHLGAESHRAYQLIRANTSPRAAMLASLLSFDAGRFADSRRHLDSLPVATRSSTAFLNQRGLLEHVKGDRDSAVATFRKAIDLDPQAACAWINLGRIYAESAEHEQAIYAFDHAVSIGETADAYLARGLSQLARGNLDEARSDITRAKSLGSSQSISSAAIGDIDAAAGNPTAALESYRLATAFHDATDAVWIKYANALIRARSFVDAETAFEHALRLSPNHSAALNGIGVARLNRGDAKGAKEILERATAADPDDPRPRMNLSLANARLAAGAK